MKQLFEYWPSVSLTLKVFLVIAALLAALHYGA